jgi:hypothetical protein
MHSVLLMASQASNLSGVHSLTFGTVNYGGTLKAITNLTESDRHSNHERMSPTMNDTTPLQASEPVGSVAKRVGEAGLQPDHQPECLGRSIFGMANHSQPDRVEVYRPYHRVCFARFHRVECSGQARVARG